MIYRRLSADDSNHARELIQLFDPVSEVPTRPMLSQEALLTRLADDHIWVWVAMDQEQVQSTDIWAVLVQTDLGDEVPNALYQSYGYEQEKVHHDDLWRRNF